jgi:hypothetical protein
MSTMKERGVVILKLLALPVTLCVALVVSMVTFGGVGQEPSVIREARAQRSL